MRRGRWALISIVVAVNLLFEECDAGQKRNTKESERKYLVGLAKRVILLRGERESRLFSWQL